MKPHEETWTAFTGDDSERFITGEGGMVASVVRDECERLACAAPDMARVLLAIEWLGRDGSCASCLRDRIDGHRSDCALDAALRKGGVR